MPDPSRTGRSLRALKDIGDRAAIWVRRLLGFLLIAMVLLNVGNAIGRYVFRRSIDGADEILIFAMAWLVFIGAAVVTWEGRHLSLGLLGALASGRAKLALAVVQLATVAGLSFFAMTQSVAFVERVAKIGQLSMGAQIPMTVPHSAVALGFGLIGLMALARLAVLLALPAGESEPRRREAS